ncbi:MAG: hypothetical protein KDA86_05320 [Planctomycetaceae bacterium]|nr:hypothetical protein [Planctomycetaceae bacterium]
MPADFNLTYDPACVSTKAQEKTPTNPEKILVLKKFKLESVNGFKGSVYLEYSVVPTSGNTPGVGGPESVYLDEDEVECISANVTSGAGDTGTLYVEGSNGAITKTANVSYP